MTTATGLALTLLLLLLNAFFVGAEFALISARRSVIEPKALDGPLGREDHHLRDGAGLPDDGRRADGHHRVLARAGRDQRARHRAPARGAAARLLGVPGAFTHPIAFVIALALVTYLHVVFGEMVPKNIALAGPERMALILSPMLMGIVTLIRPVLWLLNSIGNLVLRMLGVTPKAEVTSAFTRNEVAAMVSESREGGLLEDNDEALLLGALRFEARSVANLVIPQEKVSTLPEGVTPAQAESRSRRGLLPVPGACCRRAPDRLCPYQGPVGFRAGAARAVDSRCPHPGPAGDRGRRPAAPGARLDAGLRAPTSAPRPTRPAR